MNAKNTNLLKAKKEANDEFYTQYEDIAKEQANKWKVRLTQELIML